MLQKLPLLTSENKAFWTGGENEELLINFCEDCSTFFHPPSPLCTDCGSQKIKPRPVSGRGNVVSYTINRQVWAKGLEAPYIIAIIGLEESKNLRFVSNITDIDTDTVYIGMPVEVYFMNIEDVWLPLFKPSNDSAKSGEVKS